MMKDNLKRLNFLLKIFGHETFYVCTIWEDEIRMQGKYSDEAVRIAKKLRFLQSVDTNGYAILERGNYHIILT